MSIQPLITFKAGKCDASFDSNPAKIKPLPQPGYLYLYNDEEELVHFCWRARDASLSDPDLDLTMVPTDGSFVPYLGPNIPPPSSSETPQKSPIKGRIFVLKFASSSERHFFWLQSREQPAGDPSRISTRDLKLGEIVNEILQGGEMDASQVTALRRGGGDEGGSNGDTVMEDAPSGGDGGEGSGGSGGAGAGATGGDIREEGEGSREGGADGARANLSAAQNDPNTQIRNLLAGITSGSSSQTQRQIPSTTLPDLLLPAITLPALERTKEPQLDNLVTSLPLSILQLWYKQHIASSTTTPASAEEILKSLTNTQKMELLTTLLRSPQFTQALGGVTSALRDGGLPGISEALGVKVKEGGWLDRGRSMPLTGGAAVEAFLEGVRRGVVEEERES